MKCHKPSLLALFLVIFILSTSLHAKELKSNIQIGIPQWAESPTAYAWTREGFIEGMKALGYEEGKHVHFDIKIAEGDIEKARTMAKEFVKKKVDLICALGTIPSLVALEATKETPLSTQLSESQKQPELLILGYPRGKILREF
jgi:putative ABC transport system substrate-binding protein